MRLNQEEVENHDTRSFILGYILGNPGAHYNLIKQTLELKNGTLAYHLQVLLRERKIKKRNAGAKVRFFPYRYTIGELEDYSSNTRKDMSYLLFLQEETIATVDDIAEHFNVTRQSVYPTLKKLRAEGLIFYKEKTIIARQPITLTDKGRDEIINFLKRDREV